MLRRIVIAGGLALASAASLPARARADDADPCVHLWSPADDAERPRGDDAAPPCAATVAMTVYPAVRPTGQAVLVVTADGGAAAADRRRPGAVARLFAARGVTAFDLTHRATSRDHALHDAQRAMRLIRAQAARWGVDPARIAAVGIAGGADMVARLGGRGTTAGYRPVDAADAQAVAPQAIGLFFPAASAASPRTLAQARGAAVPATMPPTFLAADAGHPAPARAGALSMFDALQQANVPSEVVIGGTGGHDATLVDAAGTPHAWLDLFTAFAGRHGWTA